MILEGADMNLEENTKRLENLKNRLTEIGDSL